MIKYQNIKKNQAKSTKIEIFLIIIGLLCLIFLFDYNLNEKNSLFGAEQIIAGKIPYKDFSTNLMPGIFYFNAFLLKIFQNSLLAIQIIYLLIAFSISLIIYFLAKNLTKNKIAFIPFFVSIIWQSFISMNADSVPIALLLILLATIALFNYYENLRNNNKLFLRIIPLGISIGLLVIFRLDMASYMYGLFFWAMFWAGIAGVDGLGLPIWQRAARGFWKGIIFTAIVLLTVAPFAGYFIAKCGTKTLYEQLIAAPLKDFTLGNSLKFPEIFYFINHFDGNIFSLEYLQNSWFGLVFFLPILSSIFSVIALFIKYKKKLIKTNSPIFWKEVLLINLCLNLFNYAITSSDISHLLPSMLFTVMLFPNIFSIFSNSNKKNEKIGRFCLLLLLLLIISFPICSKFLQ